MLMLCLLLLLLFNGNIGLAGSHDGDFLSDAGGRLGQIVIDSVGDGNGFMILGFLGRTDWRYQAVAWRCHGRRK